MGTEAILSLSKQEKATRDTSSLSVENNNIKQEI